MAFLLPFFLNEPVCRVNFRPSRLLEQHFGVGLEPEDFLQPINLNEREFSKTPAGYLRRWRSRDSSKDTGSTVAFNTDKFEATLDVQQFKPEEITVKITENNVLTVEGKHEEKEDEFGHVSRHFIRRYVVPKGYDVSKIESKLSTDGVLTITAPIVVNKPVEHKTISITQTGEPMKEHQITEKEKKPEKKK